MSFKRYILDASYRRWPSMTDVERANYLAQREAEANEPDAPWVIGVVGLALWAIPFVYWWASA